MTTTWALREYEAGGGYVYNDELRTYNTSGTLYNYEDAPTVWTLTNKS